VLVKGGVVVELLSRALVDASLGMSEVYWGFD